MDGSWAAILPSVCSKSARLHAAAAKAGLCSVNEAQLCEKEAGTFPPTGL